MAAGWTTTELASEPRQKGHGTPTVRIRVGLSHSFCETRTGGGRCSPTGPEPTSVNIAVTGGNLYPARCCCLLLSNCRVGDNTTRTPLSRKIWNLRSDTIGPGAGFLPIVFLMT